MLWLMKGTVLTLPLSVKWIPVRPVQRKRSFLQGCSRSYSRLRGCFCDPVNSHRCSSCALESYEMLRWFWGNLSPFQGHGRATRAEKYEDSNREGSRVFFFFLLRNRLNISAHVWNVAAENCQWDKKISAPCRIIYTYPHQLQTESVKLLVTQGVHVSIYVVLNVISYLYLCISAWFLHLKGSTHFSRDDLQ